MLVVSTDSRTWAADSAALLRQGPARAGRCRIVALEGRSGSGKTRLADALAVPLGCSVFHLDDVYPGWDGLAAAVPLVREWVVEPLLHGRDPCWRRYDWERGGYSGWHRTLADEVLLVEGCGAGARDLRPYLSALVWVDVPDPVRRERLEARFDAAAYAPHRERWATQETAFYLESRPRERADLVIDNSRPVPEW
ncbi:hypothetical protein HDA32_001887 [Spinactinospora alkalitolerans]|uniref:Uridine kinase n=1 Tax=Spinactinospora alkalitolerans TaxID=687207 RepID=A0A852TTY7_9ACTN|nr:hypothetical protein [Spinactinospora alkalitolerans]NYE46767.1 hypothetical protein [Spinactinospora alkalitolerans]